MNLMLHLKVIFSVHFKEKLNTCNKMTNHAFDARVSAIESTPEGSSESSPKSECTSRTIEEASRMHLTICVKMYSKLP